MIMIKLFRVFNLYQNQTIKYIINSDQSKLKNNNKILELIGNVKLKSILENEDDYQETNIDQHENDHSKVLVAL